MKYLFGPVNSRRLGLSLGIDLLPFKTCSLDCIYCECSKTTNLTTRIDTYVPVEEVIAELREYLKDRPKLNSITFAGSGEPTLHGGIKKIIEFLKKNYPDYKITVLTNGTLLYNKKVRKSILNADIIIPSLDAASEDVFKKIGRPSKGITAAKTIKGIISLRKEFRNTIILEIFIIPGINDNETELGLLKSACLEILPDSIQLNTLDRPGTEPWIKPASVAKLQEIKAFLEPLNVEIIGDSKSENIIHRDKRLDIRDAVIATISRRPSTLEDLFLSTGIDKEEILKVINDLLKNGLIKEERSERGIFYKKNKV